ncbi:MAG: helix-turn-helix transcriptional regulator [Methanotrichaceae archaeon]
MYEAALRYIKSCEEGALQSDLWKALNIDSRKCSRIVSKLLKENLIFREPESIKGIRTYRLHYVGVPSSNRFKSLLADNIFEPCAGCIKECAPEHCPELSEWIFRVVVSEKSSDVNLNQAAKKVSTSNLSQ